MSGTDVLGSAMQAECPHVLFTLASICAQSPGGTGASPQTQRLLALAAACCPLLLLLLLLAAASAAKHSTLAMPVDCLLILCLPLSPQQLPAPAPTPPRLPRLQAWTHTTLTAPRCASSARPTGASSRPSATPRRCGRARLSLERTGTLAWPAERVGRLELCAAWPQLAAGKPSATPSREALTLYCLFWAGLGTPLAAPRHSQLTTWTADHMFDAALRAAGAAMRKPCRR